VYLGISLIELSDVIALAKLVRQLAGQNPLIHTSKLMLAIGISMVEVRIMALWRPVLVNQIEFGQVFGTF
jgi:hypothetical protein